MPQVVDLDHIRAERDHMRAERDAIRRHRVELVDPVTGKVWIFEKDALTLEQQILLDKWNVCSENYLRARDGLGVLLGELIRYMEK
jgi:hypothetical protein